MMKKLLLGALLTMSLTNAQNLLTEGFDDMTVTLGAGGWVSTNQSTVVGSNPNWNSGATVFTAYAGTSYAATNFNATSGANTISNWLISPAISLQNGDVISFWTRTVTAPAYADRLQLRLNTTAGPNPSTGSADLGGFTTLLVDINPTLVATSYPNVWTQYSATISGLPAATSCKIGLRYFVTNGGPTGANSDFIGVDSFSVDRVLSSASFSLTGVKMYPNPAKDVLNIQSDTEELTKISITDLNGRVVKEVTNNLSQISIGNLAKGIYMVTIESASAKKVEKLIIE